MTRIREMMVIPCNILSPVFAPRFDCPQKTAPAIKKPNAGERYNLIFYGQLRRITHEPLFVARATLLPASDDDDGAAEEQQRGN